MKRALILFLGFILLTSHELFLKTDAYFLNENEESKLYLFNGTFDKNENIISRDRIVNSKIIGPNYKFFPAEGDFYDKDNVTYLKFKAGKAGSYAAGISTLPRIIELSAKDFNEYLNHEELTEIISKRKEKGITDSPSREKYSKHIKALLQVAEKRSSQFAFKFGYPIEFIPLDNPYDLNQGDQISFKLLSNNKPLANYTVHYGFRAKAQNFNNDEWSVRTDKNGIFTIRLNEAGIWYVATIHMIESTEEGIDYESNWATLTFKIK